MNLEHSPAGILVSALIEASVLHSKQTASPLPNQAFYGHVDFAPPEDERVATGYDSTPVKEADLLVGGAIQQWGISIIVRGGQYEYDLVYAKASEIANWIQSHRAVNVSYLGIAYVIRSAYIDSGPIPFGREPQTNRPQFSINIVANIGVK
jgi:hypothetical protein